MKSNSGIAYEQPAWVCNNCGEKFGGWWKQRTYVGPSHHCASYHIGTCNVCNKEAPVTEARDYGYLKSGWKEKTAVN